MTFQYTVSRDAAGWLLAAVPSLPGCSVIAQTEEELDRRLAQAVDLYMNKLTASGLEPAEFLGLRELYHG